MILKHHTSGVAGVGVATLGVAGAIVAEAVEAGNDGVAGVANDGVAGVGNPGVAGVGVATLGVAGTPSSSCSMSGLPSYSSLAPVKSELDEELADKSAGAGIVKLGRNMQVLRCLSKTETTRTRVFLCILRLTTTKNTTVPSSSITHLIPT